MPAERIFTCVYDDHIRTESVSHSLWLKVKCSYLLSGLKMLLSWRVFENMNKWMESLCGLHTWWLYLFGPILVWHVLHVIVLSKTKSIARGITNFREALLCCLYHFTALGEKKKPFKSALMWIILKLLQTDEWSLIIFIFMNRWISMCNLRIFQVSIMQRYSKKIVFLILNCFGYAQRCNKDEGL